jgi:hypothetical protein
MDYESDQRNAEYLEIARLFIPSLLSRLKDGTAVPPVEVVLSDTDGTIGTWQVDGFGKFTDVSDVDHTLRPIQFPVMVLFTDRNGRTWNKHVGRDEIT